jgi:hypothetical protein
MKSDEERFRLNGSTMADDGDTGPLECMPTKIAEAQFHHVAERDGLLNLTLGFNGDPISTTALDSFAFEVNSRFHRRSPGVRQAIRVDQTPRWAEAKANPSTRR